MGALAENFLEAREKQADALKYKGFKVGYHGDEAAITFELRRPRTFPLVKDDACPHSGGGRQTYALSQSVQDREVLSLDLLEAEIEKGERKTPDSPDLAMLRDGRAALENFITQNGRCTLEASYRPQEFACA